MAAKSCRGLPAELAAKLVVKVMYNISVVLTCLGLLLGFLRQINNLLLDKSRDSKSCIFSGVMHSEKARFEHLFRVENKSLLTHDIK